MIPQTLIQEAARDGLTLAPTDKGTLRVHGPRAAIAKWAPILKERKAEVFAALKTGHVLVGELPKLSKGPFDSKDSARTNENTENAPSAEHYRLPDGREVWLSPPETVEQVQARYPGAVPIPDSVTVTEPNSAEEAAAIAYCERVAKEREAGRVPPSYTATTHCRGCGTVPVFAGAPTQVDACPWCHNRTRGLPIPRPSVSCADCAHFAADPVGHGGIGSCARGGPPQGQMAAFPHAKRKCPDFEPTEPLPSNSHRLARVPMQTNENERQ